MVLVAILCMSVLHFVFPVCLNPPSILDGFPNVDEAAMSACSQVSDGTLCAIACNLGYVASGEAVCSEKVLSIPWIVLAFSCSIVAHLSKAAESGARRRAGAA